MQPPSVRSGSPGKGLAIAVVGCAFGAVLLVAGSVFWYFHGQAKAPKPVPVAVRKAKAVHVPAPTPVPNTTPTPAVQPTETVRPEPQTKTEPGTDQAKVAEKAPETASSTPAPTTAGASETKPAAQTPQQLANNASAASEGGKSKKGKPPAGEDIFRDSLVPRLKIEIPDDGVAALRRRGRRYVQCTIREGNMVYTNVAIRLKGGPGSFRQFDDTPSLTINFDKFAEGQTFHRLKKIHLNSSVQDRTLLSEQFGRELFDAAGVPVPRAGHAAVTINGRNMGVYVLIEGINKQFLKRYFTDATGNVYEGKSQSDVTDNLPVNSGDNPTDKSRLQALAAAVRLPVSRRLAALEKVLDVDRFLSFVAVEAMLCHWDGYTANRNNYRIYHDHDTDRMVFIPHGMDQTLRNPNDPILPHNLNGLVTRAVFEIPEARERYEDRFAQLTTNVLRPDAVAVRVREVIAKVSEALAETDPTAATAYRSRGNAYLKRYQQRAAYLQRQYSPSSAPALGAREDLKLTDWEPKVDLGEARLAKEKDPKGVNALHISATNGCTASFRTHAQLSRGRYRFEARIKTEGVVLDENDPRAGAGLRVSRHRIGQKNTGSKDWTLAGFDLEVREDESEVELVCELRADKGDVWFDLDSLKLSRR